MEPEVAARLTAQSFEEETFDGLDLAGFDFSDKEFTRCTFRNGKLLDTVWDRARLEDCTFDGCDLTNLRPRRIGLRDVAFVSCKLMGVHWKDVGSFPSMSFTGCSMRYQSFLGIQLRKTQFLRCSLVESTFVEVDLAKSVFRDCDLTKTQLERCDLTGVDFSTSHGVYFEVARNKCKGARIPVEMAALMASALGLRVAGYEGAGKKGE